ncbi:MAG: V-type ATP synthase subunit I [Actinomycetota bacterium]|nr:V-type ATP synthase subunit I [Actinomycetota bacterium]
MALEPVKKVLVITRKNLEDEVVDSIARLGALHIQRLLDPEVVPPRSPSSRDKESERKASAALSKVDFALSFLTENKKGKRGFIKSLVKDKYEMKLEEFLEAGERVNLDEVHEACLRFDGKLKELSERKSRLETEISELDGWKEVEIPLDALKGGTYYEIKAFFLKGLEPEEFSSLLFEKVPASELFVVRKHKDGAVCIVIYYRHESEAVEELLSSYEEVAIPRGEASPSELIARKEKERSAIEQEISELIEDVQEYTDYIADLEILHEYILFERGKLEARKSMGETDSTVVVESWIGEGKIEKARKTLLKISDEIEVEVLDPEPGDDPPVLLKNPRLLKPFEFLVKLYGFPNNRETDPTWLVAFSFILFFGFCIGDIGYAFLLFAVFQLIKKYLPVGKNTSDLLTVLSYGCGFAAVMGVLTGSWFGVDTEKLPAILKTPIIFDSLNDPIPLMLVCIVIGLIHMLIGTAVEFRDSWREGAYSDALIDQGLVLFFFGGGILAAGLAFAHLIPMWVVFLVAGLGLGGMLVLLGHHSKSLVGKIFGGLYETYNVLGGWLGDTVSYLRLFALGLATFAVGWVINIMAEMVSGAAPVIGVLLMLIVIIIGHCFNAAINLLGAVVHPLRLEYVEFFGKFYEDGGRKFTPLGVDSKVVMISDMDS